VGIGEIACTGAIAPIVEDYMEQCCFNSSQGFKFKETYFLHFAVRTTFADYFMLLVFLRQVRNFFSELLFIQFITNFLFDSARVVKKSAPAVTFLH